MRRPLLICSFFCFAALGAAEARAEDDPLVDRVAAEFYEKSLRRSQSRNIEAATAEIYRRLDEEEKSAFRERRRRAWQDMNETARHSLRGVKTPKFRNLTETQKAPFRRAAERRLGAGENAGRPSGKDEI